MLNNIYIEIFLYIHYLITLSFVLLPFLPLKFILDYKLFLAPIGITIYWLIFDGCHLSKMHKNKKEYIYLKSVREIASCNCANRSKNEMNADCSVTNLGDKINTTQA